MEVLYGIEAPPGDGMVIEVHLDMMEASVPFLERLSSLGFEDDPFLEFHPTSYRYHYTGRTRAISSDVRKVLPDINRLIALVIQEAKESNINMYAECELVRETHHFDDSSPRSLSAFGGLAFREAASDATAKADVHVEFRRGTVPEQVRTFLTKSAFYWVSTPASKRFPAEEIATLQTSSYYDAQQVYERLVTMPLPFCTGIHLEQKLSMTPSFPDVPMPEVAEIIVEATSQSTGETSVI